MLTQKKTTKQNTSAAPQYSNMPITITNLW